MKINNFKAEELEVMANMLKAIAHPARINIISILEDGEMYSVTELYKLLNVDQATMSHHLSILKHADIISHKRDGRNILYCLKNKNFTKMMECLGKCSSKK